MFVLFKKAQNLKKKYQVNILLLKLHINLKSLIFKICKSFKNIIVLV